jgi:hypothetical protein
VLRTYGNLIAMANTKNNFRKFVGGLEGILHRYCLRYLVLGTHKMKL